MKTKEKSKQKDKYQPQEIEKKWQKKWEEAGLYNSDLSKKNKKYVLAEFAYPSGDLHLGHWFTFSGADIYARKKRMEGYQVFFPNGFDAFGLPAENAAIKQGVHPKDWTLSNIAKMKQQYESMGASFSFDHEVITCLPEYYKWNQWIFLQFYKKDLAYRSKTLSNWCPVDQTVLANEHVVDGKCWRCGAQVEQKPVEQWFLKITDYADKLLWLENPAESPERSRRVDWPKSVRVAQNDWIGRSEGVEIEFRIKKHESRIMVFTTALDTIFGVTFMVLSPEHPLVRKITSQDKQHVVDEYQKQSEKKSELERTALEKEKTGVFTGAYAINPFNGEEVPIWIADYVLISYGTGAVMGVPGHDARDHEFAQRYGLKIKPVIKPSPQAKNAHVAGDGFWDYTEIKTKFADESILFDSGQFDGLTNREAKKKMEEFIEQKGFGKRAVQYHLHDWSVSRQRYWGTPVPMIHCPDCGIVPVLEKDLPVELPYDVDYTPKGKPPLASNEEWLKVKCPQCGKEAKRDAETLDTFFDSSWYFFRYIDPHNDKEPFDKLRASQVMPVDIYFGGAEHTLGHTLYSRFFTKFLKDFGLTDLEEYAKRRVNHGVVLGPDGNRMSKSKGNVVNPDEEVKKYGADTIRVYLAFFIPYDGTGPWISDRVWGACRFLQRVWSLQEKVTSNASHSRLDRGSMDSRFRGNDMPAQDLRQMHKAIRKVTEDIEQIHFNTAVAALMEWLNYLSSKDRVSDEEYKTYLLLLAPFAPHMAEELSQLLNSKFKIQNSKFQSIHLEKWPEYNEKYLEEDEVTIAVQINGKLRDTIQVQSATLRLRSGQELKVQSEVEQLARQSQKVKGYLDKMEVKKVVHIPGKILNFVGVEKS